MNRQAKLTGILLTLALSGCMSTSPDWDARFGDSARTLAAQQVIAPEASLAPDSATGVDGKAAQGAMSEYAKSFTQPQPQPDVLTIGVGSSGQ